MVPLRPRPTWQYAGQVVYDETRRQFQWACMAAAFQRRVDNESASTSTDKWLLEKCSKEPGGNPASHAAR